MHPTLTPALTQDALLAELVQEALRIPDHPIDRLVRGECLIGVSSRRVGLASLVSTIAPDQASDQAGPPCPLPEPGTSAHDLARRLLEPDSQGTDVASLAMAAINSLLPPPAVCAPAWGQDVLMARGRGKAVAVVGHFPFVSEVRHAFAQFWVLEKRPQPGDLDASMAEVVLPRADLVAITATTLLNGTLAGLLALCRPDALVALLGPTTPFASCLLAHGITVLAGCHVTDPDAAFSGIRAGRFFRQLAGARQLAWETGARPEPSRNLMYA